MAWGMTLRRTATALAAAAALGPVSAAAVEAPYAAWKAANPNPEARVAGIKARTAALVAAAPAGLNPSDIDRPALIWRTSDAGAELWDGPDLPKMVVAPAGEYTMGSPDSEPGRRANEGPRHRVRIGYAFAVSQYPITVAQFAKFVDASGHQIESGSCYFYNKGHYQNANACTWRTTGFDQGDDSPVVGISWKDSQAYVAWLSKTTGHAYRLLTEAEFEYVNRAGTATAYWWGDDPLEACKHANGADQKTLTDPQFAGWTANGCNDGYVYTAPVGAFGPNPFGLYGATGNAWSFTEDCWNETYAGAPLDGAAFLAGNCTLRVVRGGSWADTAAVLRSSSRNWNYFEVQPVIDGLRIARTL